MMLKKYLENVKALADKCNTREGYNYSCYEDLILDRGKYFDKRPLTREERQIVERAIGNDEFFERHCFSNAIRLVLADKTRSLTYVEGFATAHVAVHHAWAVINGAVIDVTWDGIESLREVETEYYGLEFFDRDALRLRLRNKYSVSMLYDWNKKDPLLRQERLHERSNPNERDDGADKGREDPRWDALGLQSKRRSDRSLSD